MAWKSTSSSQTTTTRESGDPYRRIADNYRTAYNQDHHHKNKRKQKESPRRDLRRTDQNTHNQNAREQKFNIQKNKRKRTVN